MKSAHPYRERDYAFGNLCVTLRTAIGVTQGELARLLVVTERAIQAWEGGSSYPKVDSLQRFIVLCVQHHAFAVGREEEEIRALWKAARQRVLLDELWLHKLLSSAHPQDMVHETGANADPGPASSLRAAPTVSPSTSAFPRIDWTGALDVSSFHGREVELAELSRWILQEHCRLVAVLGMGGIGKSVLVSLLGRQLAPHFDAVLWRSVRDAPSCDDLVADCVTFFSDTPPAEFPSSLEQRINQLVGRLQERPCLLVLDNLETLLLEGDPEGKYLPGYEGYGRLIGRLAESAHRSCVVLTSREKPREIEAMEGKRAPVRSLHLSGLSEEAARTLLEDKDLRGESSVWLQLISTYAGNPLALKIVGQAIIDLFNGDIEEFLQSGELIFNGIRAVLRQQVARLTPLEQTLLTWLAVVREWTSFETLLSLQIPRVVRGRMLEALEALSRRSLIERAQQADFTLQSVVMEYITDALLDQLTEEIVHGTGDHLRRYRLEQVQAKDYVRESQLRLLVHPLLDRLRAEFGPDTRIEEHLLDLLAHLRARDATTQGYSPANVLSLLKELRGDLRGLDLSRLSILGAYLQGVEMQDASFAGTHLRDAVFTSAFDAVNAVAVSPDGRYWAAGSYSGEVRVWREEGRTQHQVLRAHADRVGSMAFSPTGQVLASASLDGTVKMWDVATGAGLQTLRGHDGPVQSIAFNPDGDLLVSAGNDGSLRFWAVRTGTCLRVIEAHPEPIYAVAWSPDGRLLASGGIDRTIQLWELQSWNSIQTLLGHTSEVLGLAFAPDGTLLASASADQTVKLWEVKMATCRATLQGHTGSVAAVAWSPDARLVISAGSDTAIRLWDRDSGRLRNLFLGHTDTVWALAFTPDGKTLLTGGSDQTIRVWEIAGGQQLRILQGYAVSHFAVAWSPDGRDLLSRGNDTTVVQWRVSDRAPVQIYRGHTRAVCALSWRPDGRMFASGSYDQTVRIWDATTGRCERILQGHTDVIASVAWSPDGCLLATGSYDQTVCVWDLNDGKLRWIGRAHVGMVQGVAWHPDGTRVVSGGSDGAVLVWQTTDGDLLQRLQGHGGFVCMVDWSPDGTQLASCAYGGRGGELFIWETTQGMCTRVMERDDSIILSVTWSPDGRLLVGGCMDGTLRWWEVARGVVLGTIKAHTANVYSVRVSPDGKTLASGGEDGVIRLWDMATRNHLATLRSDRPYERLNITGVMGLSEAQKVTLKALGAVEEAVALLAER